jgi:hypothetical protein
LSPQLFINALELVESRHQLYFFPGLTFDPQAQRYSFDRLVLPADAVARLRATPEKAIELIGAAIGNRHDRIRELVSDGIIVWDLAFLEGRSTFVEYAIIEDLGFLTHLGYLGHPLASWWGTSPPLWDIVFHTLRTAKRRLEEGHTQALESIQTRFTPQRILTLLEEGDGKDLLEHIVDVIGTGMNREVRSCLFLRLLRGNQWVLTRGIRDDPPQSPRLIDYITLPWATVPIPNWVTNLLTIRDGDRRVLEQHTDQGLYTRLSLLRELRLLNFFVTKGVIVVTRYGEDGGGWGNGDALYQELIRLRVANNYENLVRRLLPVTDPIRPLDPQASFIISPNDSKVHLEVDLWLRDAHIGFEVQGPHHYLGNDPIEVRKTQRKDLTKVLLGIAIGAPILPVPVFSNIHLNREFLRCLLNIFATDVLLLSEPEVPTAESGRRLRPHS